MTGRHGIMKGGISMTINNCPFCGQGRIFRVRLKTDISAYSDSQIIRLCDECDGIWKLDEPITAHTGASLHVLAEKLGIPEEQLWDGMETVQIELLYDNTEKTLRITDFQPGGSHSDFTAADTLWGQKLRINVSFSEALGKTAETLAAALPAICNKLAFLEELEDNIRQYTVYKHLDQLAAERLSPLAKNGNGKTVTLADGSTVPADVTPESFTASLYPVEIRFAFRDSTERSQADLMLGCKPDYFAGHRIRISINEQYRIECEGI